MPTRSTPTQADNPAALTRPSDFSDPQTEDIHRRKALPSDREVSIRMHALTGMPLGEAGLTPLLQEIIDVAVFIVGAERGTLQLLEGDSLQILAHHGHKPAFLEFFASADKVASVCGEALKRGQRVVVADVAESSTFAGTPSLTVLQQAGVRAVQSTPLCSRTGALLGILTTQWSVPYTPDEHSFWRLDLLARQAADLIEIAKTQMTLRESEQKSRTAFAHAAIGFTITDLDGHFIDANPAYCALTGYSLPELHKLHFSQLVHPDDLAENARLRDSMLAGEIPSFVVENRYIRKDGLPVWVRKSISLVRNAAGASQWMIALVEDVTERKQAEEDLKKTQANLEAALAGMTATAEALAKAKAAAEDSNHQKDHFLAVLGHELRNPLAPIRNAVALMKRYPDELTWQRARDLIDRQVTHMVRLIDDLLDVSRIERGKVMLRKEEFDLAEVLKATVEDHRPLLDETGVTLDFSATSKPFHAYGDADRIAQVVGNLMVNANKFTDRGGRVSVELSSKDDHSAVIKVRDTGIGMDAETLRCMFKPFVQAERSVERSRGGLGLGLALTKGLVELHGGSVQGKSSGLGKGSEFQVVLPILLHSPAGTCPKPPAADNIRPRRVLIIEDNVDAAESLRMLLELGGHLIAVAHSGPDGMQQARIHKPDIVLCDIGLPGGMDGYAVARAMREDPELRAAYLVAMTGYGQDDDRKRAKVAGFNAHLTKPTDPDNLEKILAR
jgi:PAS domain S-box-containing protein